jgi:hypothetical protein
MAIEKSQKKIDDEMEMNPPSEVFTEDKSIKAITAKKPQSSLEIVKHYQEVKLKRPLKDILEFLLATIGERKDYFYEARGKIDMTKDGAFWVAREYGWIYPEPVSVEQITYKIDGKVDDEKSGWLVKVRVIDTISCIGSIGVGFSPFYAIRKSGPSVWDDKAVLKASSIAQRNAILDIVDAGLIKDLAAFAKKHNLYLTKYNQD